MSVFQNKRSISIYYFELVQKNQEKVGQRKYKNIREAHRPGQATTGTNHYCPSNLFVTGTSLIKRTDAVLSLLPCLGVLNCVILCLDKKERKGKDSEAYLSGIHR